MKLILLLTIVLGLQVNASVYSQTTLLSLKVKETPIREVLSQLEESSKFKFFYNEDFINVDIPVSLKVSDNRIDEILEKVLWETDIDYQVLENNMIVLTKKNSSQEITIKGKVTDIDGNPLPGVNVVEKGTTNGSVTNLDGEYSISVSSPDAILSFSYVGYLSEDVEIDQKSVINITMIEDVMSLEEVVVIGYGTVKKSDLTGSVASVKSKDITVYSSSNVMQAVAGRAAGVQVNQNNGSPGAPISVRIRGANSIKGSNEPLYIIDGFPGNISTISNSDIASIEILKDASATAIYGSRGANGVVLVTTKQGEVGATRIDFESSFGIQTLRKKLELMNAREYAEFYNEQLVNDGLEEYFSQSEINSFGEGTDWQDLCFREAPIAINSLSVTGGNEKNRFAVSGSVYNQDGIIEGSDYNRYSLLGNFKHDVGKRFTIDYGLNLTKNTRAKQNSSGGNRGGSLLASIISSPPTLTPYNDDGSIRDLATTSYPFVATSLVNPFYYIDEETNNNIENLVRAHAALIYKPIDGMTIKISGGINSSDYRGDYYKTTNYLNSQGYASVSTSQYTGLINENTINYTKTINEKHSITALAGVTIEDEVSKGLSASGTGFLSDASETYDIGSAETIGVPGTSYTKASLMSYLGRINYTYDNKYLFTTSFRADGSSKYSEGSKWGYFPSGAFAWRVTNEPFMNNLTIISDLKLRTSWGTTGSQAISAYATLNQLGSGKTVFGNSLYTIYAPSTTLPGDLKWETTEQTDFGLDIAFLDGKYRFTADYYIKNTKDLLNTVQLPPTSGYSQTIKNVGQIRNQGLELALGANVINSNFKWNLNGNISFNKSEVVKLYGGEDIIGGSVSVVFIGNVYSLLREGEPMNVFYGYLDDGYDSEGIPQYKDINDDGLINLEDRQIIGDPNPDFIYGLNSDMSYKNFSLTMFWQGSYGNDIANVSAIGNSLDYVVGMNMIKEVYDDHWTPENTDAKYPKLTNSLDMEFSERIVEDGSYLRLRNIQLAYNIPVEKANWLRNASVYISGQNLITITKYSWWDPEVNSLGGSNSLRQGIDYYTYPTAKNVTVGIKVGF